MFLGSVFCRCLYFFSEENVPSFAAKHVFSLANSDVSCIERTVCANKQLEGVSIFLVTFCFSEGSLQ